MPEDVQEWEFRPAPSRREKARHDLLLNFVPTDLRDILRRFGRFLGRPRRAEAPFRYSIPIRNLTGSLRSRLENLFEKFRRDRVAEKAQLESIRITPDFPETIFPETISPETISPETFEEESLPDVPERVPDLQTAEPPPVPAPPPLPPHLLVRGGPPPLPPHLSAKGEPPPLPPEGPSFSIEKEIDLESNFERLKVETLNRGAHAASHSVVEHPGGLHNPLLLTGPDGVGKTSFLNAIVQGLRGRADFDGEVLFVDGSRLLEEARRRREANDREGWRELFAGCEVLVIDEFHCANIPEEDLSWVGEPLSLFAEEGKQVVFSSTETVRTLKPFLGTFGLDLDQGKTVEMNPPPKGSEEGSS